MTNTYTIPAIVKDELQKKLEKLSKKANAYGSHLEWRFSDEFVVTRNICTVDPVTKTQEKTGDEKVFAVDITIDSDIIKKDGYTVVAQIEAIGNGQNIVKMFDDTPAETAWYTTQLFCEHCGTHRFRKFAFIVKDEAGNCKMVGKSCLKDYCGIDPNWIAMSQQLTDEILNDYDIDEYDFSGSGEYGYEVVRMIAEAYDIIKEHGYVKSDEEHSTKSRLMYETRTDPSEEGMKFAEQMQDELSKADFSELSSFLCNVKNLIAAKYCRMNAFGYIAYAPVAFKNLMKKKEQEQNREEAKGLSNYIGNIGDKITVEVKDVKLVTSWETVYGFTHLYKFTTTDNNVLVWYASKCIDENVKKIAGTIKDHKEYDGEKQTVLTRCKVVEKKEVRNEPPSTEKGFDIFEILAQFDQFEEAL